METNRLSNRYYISDHHFGHDNIRKFEPEARPFDNATDMGIWLVAQHNSRITKQDLVIFGGDVAVGKNAKSAIAQFLPQMNGKKHLILGNHDDLPHVTYSMYFDKILLLKSDSYKKERVWVTHIPIHPSELDYRVKFNIHGHTHSRLIEDKRYKNMCVEQCDGVPQTIDEIMTNR